MKILGTGLTGLVGSRIVELLSPQYEFENISRGTGVDITDFNSVMTAVKASSASYILHLAAKANVDGCEEDKVLGKDGEAWKINVVGSENIIKAALATGKKVIYISTDFVFDGTKPLSESYSEGDTPNPLNWYAQTKFEGEKLMSFLGEGGLIVRIAYPYRADFAKNDFVRGMLSAIKDGKTLKGVTNHIFCPTLIDDIAVAIDALIQNSASGVYHVVGSQALSPFDASEIIAKIFGQNLLIEKTTREEFFAGRAQRPYNLQLKNDKISQLNVKMRTFEEGIQEVKLQIQDSK